MSYAEWSVVVLLVVAVAIGIVGCFALVIMIVDHKTDDDGRGPNL